MDPLSWLWFGVPAASLIGMALIAIAGGFENKYWRTVSIAEVVTLVSWVPFFLKSNAHRARRDDIFLNWMYINLGIETLTLGLWSFS